MNYEEIICRAVELFGYETEKELAQLLDISQQSFSNRKKTGGLLKKLIELVSDVHENVNLDWLIYGRGTRYISADDIGTDTLPQSSHDLPCEETQKMLEMARTVVESGTHWSKSLKSNIESLYIGLVSSENDRRKADQPEKIPQETGDRRKKSG